MPRSAQVNLRLLSVDPPDLDAARHWFQKAADTGHPLGMHSLGLLLLNVEPPDLDGARHWFQKAADAGDTEAMDNLGWLLKQPDESK
jgi:TPR repeat protein